MVIHFAHRFYVKEKGTSDSLFLSDQSLTGSAKRSKLRVVIDQGHFEVVSNEEGVTGSYFAGQSLSFSV